MKKFETYRRKFMKIVMIVWFVNFAVWYATEIRHHLGLWGHVTLFILLLICLDATRRVLKSWRDHPVYPPQDTAMASPDVGK